jgi:hypothetical protein
MPKNPIWAGFKKERRRFDREQLVDWLLAISWDVKD